MSVSVPIPGLRLVSEANYTGHWRVKARRVKAQRNIVALVLRGTVVREMLLVAPITVTITRIAPTAGLDDDNLVSSAKAVRDQVADCLGLPNDRDPRVTWRVTQARGAWSIHIRIEPQGVLK